MNDQSKTNDGYAAAVLVLAYFEPKHKPGLKSGTKMELKNRNRTEILEFYIKSGSFFFLHINFIFKSKHPLLYVFYQFQILNLVGNTAIILAKTKKANSKEVRSVANTQLEFFVQLELV